MNVYEIDGKYKTKKPFGTKVVTTKMQGGTRVLVLKKRYDVVNTICFGVFLFLIMSSTFLKGNRVNILFKNRIEANGSLVNVSVVNKDTSLNKFFIEVYDEEGDLVCKSEYVNPGESIGLLPLLKTKETGEHIVTIEYNIQVSNKMRVVRENIILSIIE